MMIINPLSLKCKIGIVKKIHLWIGLTSGFIASLSGLSGSLYVWQPELSQMLNPRILLVSGVDTINEKTIHKTALELFNRFGGNLAVLSFPYREQQSIQLVFKNGESLFFQPATGTLLGEKTISIRIFEHLLSFHRTFLIPRFGKYIVGGSTILFLSLLLTSGFYLWWKRYKRNLKGGFSWPGKVPERVFNYDLHKVVGILFLIPLFIISLSGSFFTFMPTWKNVLQILDSSTERIEKKSTGTYNYSQPIDALRFPSNDGYKLRAVYFPSKTPGVYQFRYIKDRFITSGLRKTKEIRIDEDNQVKILAEYHQSSTGEKVAAQAYSVHIGETLGLPGRIVVYISGFIPIILLITGYRFYRVRKLNFCE